MKRRLLGNSDIPIEYLEQDDSDDRQFSAGQSGGSQGLSRHAEAGPESIEELADSGQAVEAEAVAGVEDAADHPEKPAQTHADYSRLYTTKEEEEED